MTSREEIWEEDIRELRGKIKRLQTQLKNATDHEEKISLGAQITAKTEELLSAFIKSQQGTFFPNITITLSQCSRCNPLSYFSTPPPHQIQVPQQHKVSTELN